MTNLFRKKCKKCKYYDAERKWCEYYDYGTPAVLDTWCGDVWRLKNDK